MNVVVLAVVPSAVLKLISHSVTVVNSLIVEVVRVVTPADIHAVSSVIDSN